MDDRKSRFEKPAEKRVNNTLKCIQLIGNLSNKSNYEYSQDDVAAIFRAIKQELHIAESRFKSNQKNNKFKLRG